MSWIYRVFLKGLLTVLPILITLYLLVWLASSAESAFGEPLKAFLPVYVPGLGVLVVLVLIFIVGLLVSNYLASRWVGWLEETLQKVPFIKTIYNPLREVMNLFARDSGGSSKRAVIVELPGLGVSVIGLVTREVFDDLPSGTVAPGQIAVFVPYSYAVGGFTLLVPKSHVRAIDLAPERAMQLAVTAWIKGDRRINHERAD